MSNDADKSAFQANCTMPYAPTVRQVLQAVTRDLRRHRANQALKAQRIEFKKQGANPKALGKAQGTVVLKTHLNKAGDERHVLRAMIKDHINCSSYSQPFPVRLLYGDADTLKTALVEAEKHYGKLSR